MKGQTKIQNVKKRTFQIYYIHRKDIKEKHIQRTLSINYKPVED